MLERLPPEEGGGAEGGKAKGKAKGKTGLGGVPQGGSGGSPPFEAVRTRTHKYIEYNNGERELYALSSDPYELDNVYESADPSLVEDLETRLDELKSCAGDGCQEAEDAT